MDNQLDGLLKKKKKLCSLLKGVNEQLKNIEEQILLNNKQILDAYFQP